MTKFWLDNRLFDEAAEGGEGSSGAGEEEIVEGDGEEGEESSEEKTEEEEDLSDEELKNAKGLFKLLKDPNTRDIVLRTMAEKAGVLGKDTPETKKEVTKAIRDVSDVLKDSLGPEYYALFGDKLSKGLKELFAQEREESTKSVESMRLQQVETETDRAFEKLARETKGDSDKFKGAMSTLADKMLPADGVSTIEYLRMLYQVASGNKTRATASKQIADKINRNRSDVADRTHQIARGTGTGSGKEGEQPKGLRSIVEQAVKSANLKK